MLHEMERMKPKNNLVYSGFHRMPFIGSILSLMFYTRTDKGNFKPNIGCLAWGGMNKKASTELISELLKNSKRSDRELARVLGMSQASVSRLRNKLVKDGLIFTIIPDIVKMGFEILAISSFRSKSNKEIAERAIGWTASKPYILFAARAEGMGKNAVVISIHKDFTHLSNFLTEIRREGEGIIEDYDTLLISLKGFIAKHFSLRYFAELVKTSQE